jgi:hypothetical protein
MKTIKIKAYHLSVGMIVVGQRSLIGVNLFTVKHVVYSADGTRVRYKMDRINPSYLKYDGTFSKHVNETITVVNN